MTINLNPPLLIVGAPRSGTNALRDALCAMGGFATWPCDELNPLWRTGNRHITTDELTVSEARPEVVSRIRKSFANQARRNPQATIVEKTCANSLRLDFVEQVVPEARYVEIVRDGRDAASSAAERWGATFDLGYSVRKARFVPVADLAGVAVTQVRNRIERLRGPQQASVKSWGPRFDGLDELIVGGASLPHVCATQWAACTEASARFLTGQAADKYLQVRYEDFTTDPAATLGDIAEFTGVKVTAAELNRAAGTIHGRSIGRWKKTPLADDEAALDALAPMLAQLDYAIGER